MLKAGTEIDARLYGARARNLHILVGSALGPNGYDDDGVVDGGGREKHHKQARKEQNWAMLNIQLHRSA